MADNTKKAKAPKAKAPKEEAVTAPVPAPNPRPVEPAWDVTTWMSLANVKVGVRAHVMAGALHGVAPGALLTETEVRDRLKKFVG